MPVTIDWYIENHVLLVIYSGDVTIDDIRQQYEKGIALSESVNTPMVHLIVELDNLQSFPKRIADYKSVAGEKAKNSGWVILVGENKMIRFIASIVSNVMKTRYTYVSTREDALAYIQERDSSVLSNANEH